MSEPHDPKRDEEAEGDVTSPKGASSSEEPSDAPVSTEDADMLDEVDVRELMRLALEEPPQGEPPDILKGVQGRLRARSRGKFYGDGWSTTRAPRSTYLVTSIVMLVLITFVFLVLIPWGGGALPLP